MIILKNNRLQLRALVEDDAYLLVKWLSDPRVLQYYEGRDRPNDLELVRKNFYNRSYPITQCIIQYDEQDIGYIQFYLIDEEEIELYGYSDFDGNIYGMDQFIGEVEFWNKGIGTELIQATRDYLIQHKGAKKIVMDPQTWNERALRVYEKCGFRKVKLLPKKEWHEGEYRDCWLIEYDATDFTVEGAMEFSKSGRIEDWVHLFLTSVGHNQGLSDGLKLQKRYWVGPVLIPLDILKRSCGPEEDMEYVEPLVHWEGRVNKLRSLIGEGWSIPPLIAENRDNGLSLRDGNHRLEAMKREGIEECWVIIWDSQQPERLEKWKGKG